MAAQRPPKTEQGTAKKRKRKSREQKCLEDDEAERAIYEKSVANACPVLAGSERSGNRRTVDRAGPVFDLARAVESGADGVGIQAAAEELGF